MQARRSKSALVIPPEVDTLKIMEIYCDLDVSENDTRFRQKFQILFGISDVIRAYMLR